MRREFRRTQTVKRIAFFFPAYAKQLMAAVALAHFVEHLPCGGHGWPGARQSQRREGGDEAPASESGVDAIAGHSRRRARWTGGGGQLGVAWGELGKAHQWRRGEARRSRDQIVIHPRTKAGLLMGLRSKVQKTAPSPTQLPGEAAIQINPHRSLTSNQ